MRVKIHPSEIKTLVPMSATLSRLTNLMSDINAKTSDIARVIELDSVLTVNVLRWANSAFYGAHMPVESVRGAVIRLGMNNIIRLSIGSCLAGSMKQSVPGYRLAEQELWRHNVAAALTVESLGALTRRPVPPAAFTAALIHDIGKVVLGQHLQKEMFQQLQQLQQQEGLCYIEAERRLLETDHAEVGAAIAGYLKFPEELVKAIERHHDPAPREDSLLDAVIIANAAAKQIGFGSVCGTSLAGVLETAMRRYGLEQEQWDGLCETVKQRLAKVEEEWGGAQPEARSGS
ncbi:MAG: HDOD domain-containing protein [candidate division FCPU426 bacterium]